MKQLYSCIQLPLIAAALLVSSVSYAATTAGKTMVVKGQVEAFEVIDDKRRLKRRSPIYSEDTVATSSNSKAQFRMTDGTLLAIKESSKLNISEYQYTPGSDNNSAVIELVEGGLRSVTGAIKANNGSYKLKTPVGSIGIRGTHFEIEIVEGEMFLAVWDGAIDLTVDTGGGSDSTVSFGEGEDFSFGIVSEKGEVTQLLEAPQNFDQGHSENNNQNPRGTQQQGNNQANGNTQQPPQGPNAAGQSPGPNLAQNNNENIGRPDGPAGPPNESSDTGAPNGPPGAIAGLEITNPAEEQLDDLVEEIVDLNRKADPSFIENRVGEFSFGTLIDSSANSSAGGARNLQVNMTVDFDNIFVLGELSLTDNSGEWVALFAGAFEGSDLFFDVGFATHGDELADGEINGFFANEGNRIVGDFNLFELNNTSVTANGTFSIE